MICIEYCDIILIIDIRKGRGFKEVMRKNENKYVAIELLGMAFLSTAGVWVKLSNIGPISMGFYRMLMTLIILLPFTFGSLKNVTKKQFWYAFLGGVGLGGDVLFWNVGLMKTSIADCALMVNLTVFIVPPISFIFFKEKIKKEFLIGTVVAFAGVIMVIFSSSQSGGQSSVAGNMIAMIASVSYAAYVLFVYKVRDTLNNKAVVLISTFGALVVLFLAMAPLEGLKAAIDMREFVIILMYTICTQLLGQALVSMCLGKLNATLVTVISLMGIGTAALYGYLIFGEKLVLLQIIGILVTAVGVVLAKKASQSA